jgi:PAS domain S-box-containing protein
VKSPNEREGRFERLFDLLPDAALVVREGKILLGNPSAAALLGVETAAGLIGRDLPEFVHPDYAEILREQIRITGEEGKRLPPLDQKFIAADGRVFRAQITAVPFEWEEEPSLLFFVRDVTGREDLDERIRQIQKMQAVGTLAGGIAHDFNNMLTGILGYASLLKTDSSPGDAVYEAAHVIETAARRAADLTQKLVGFAREGKIRNVPVDVHAVLREVASLLSRTVDPSIRIQEAAKADNPFVQGDPSQIQQVLLNLALNARDAMPQGGRMVLATACVDIDDEFCRRHPGSSPGRHLHVSVSDTGAGIPEEIRDRVFEPFFTTRGPGRGMGLATVYGIVKGHGGWVEFESSIGQGTTFDVYLSSVAAEKSDHPGEPAGKGLVLVVDDEEVVRNVAARLIRGLGYRVALASDGVEAIEYCRAHPGEVGAILLDVVMPRMDGPRCLRALREMGRHPSVIVSTGHGRRGVVQEMLDQGAVAFVDKPYTASDLAAALSKAVTGSSGWSSGG